MKKSWLLLAALTTLVSTGAIASTPSPTGVETQTLIDLGRRDGPTSTALTGNNSLSLIDLGRRDGPTTFSVNKQTILISTGRRDGCCIRS